MIIKITAVLCAALLVSCAPATLNLTVWEMSLSEPVSPELERTLTSQGFREMSSGADRVIYEHVKHKEQLFCIDKYGGGTRITAVLFKPALVQGLPSRIVFGKIIDYAKENNIEVSHGENRKEYVSGLCP